MQIPSQQHSYAAIKITRDSVITIIQSVHDVPAGRERLCWALFRFPYDSAETFYFVGGNYLGLKQPQFDRQILTEHQLRKYFEFSEKIFDRATNPSSTGPKPEGSWFVIRPKPDQIERLKNGLDVETAS